MEVHVDYKTEMDKQEEISFHDLYENAIVNIETSYRMSDELKNLLKNKRDFGLEKYGEYSFQSNMKNSLSVPTIKHLKEELVDSFNYIFHEIYKQKLLGKDEDLGHTYAEIVSCLKRAWNLSSFIEAEQK